MFFKVFFFLFFFVLLCGLKSAAERREFWGKKITKTLDKYTPLRVLL